METEGKWAKGQPSLPPGSVGPKLTERKARNRAGGGGDGWRDQYHPFNAHPFIRAISQIAPVSF
jgi:hypothetical protein